MRLVAIGPGNVRYYLQKINPLSSTKYFNIISDIARSVVKSSIELAILPDRGMPLDLAVEVKRYGGTVVGLVPFSDKIWGIKHLEPNLHLVVDGQPLFDEFIDVGDWFKADDTIGLYGDGLLFLGHSPGSIRELASSIYFYHLVSGIKKEARIDPRVITPHARMRADSPYYVINYLPLSGFEFPLPLVRYAEDYGVSLKQVGDLRELELLLARIS